MTTFESIKLIKVLLATILATVLAIVAGVNGFIILGVLIAVGYTYVATMTRKMNQLPKVGGVE